MPSPRSATAATHTSRSAKATKTAGAPKPAARPRRVPSGGQTVRVRWDRLGRVGLLIVLLVVVGLYVKQGLSLLSTRAQSEQQLGIVDRLTRENAQLSGQRDSLSNPATIERDARALGMVRTGERPYVITGLPNR
jgi:cell division protein FtsB